MQLEKRIDYSIYKVDHGVYRFCFPFILAPISQRMQVDRGRVLMGQSSHHVATIGHRMPLDGVRVLMGHVVSLLPSYR